MTRRALRPAEKEGFASALGLTTQCGIEAPENVQLWRWRKVEQVLKLAHEVQLAATFERVDALARGARMVAVTTGLVMRVRKWQKAGHTFLVLISSGDIPPLGGPMRAER